MKIVVLKERQKDEKRVALVPAHLGALIKLGNTVLVQAGAGLPSGYTDQEYQEKGGEIFSDPSAALSDADLVLSVRAGAADADGTLPYASMKKGAVVVATMEPWQAHPSFQTMSSAGLTAFALESIPRTTRAQAMDVLSSQANLAGYQGVLEAAVLLPKLFPMMMTAAGTVVPAKVFVLGAGVAGLQAIATARRLGAVVSAFDVRSAVKEQVESLGARFVAFDIGDASGAGGYAKALTPEQEVQQKALMADYIRKEGVDVIISTAAIPGRPSPKLITEDMVKAMAPGSVIVDLASERGGNCVLTKPGETVVAHGVTIAGLTNVASRSAYHASQLYSKNVVTFLGLLFDKEKKFTINREDDIVAACLLLQDGIPAREGLAQTLGLKE